ncbi:MAG: type II toxin-antitoxin system VapC family toxin [Pseudomonadota bacterium]|nr:type II toxin-antitoxin system VapC family toxin [Pseudomonadota bacterium]
MIAVDTNLLARFYCDDPSDPEARRQRPAARRVITESPALFVAVTVVLELEWVMRGFYELVPNQVCSVLEHLLGMPHVTVERWELVKDATDLHRAGMDFADALHWSASRGCDSFISFDKALARRSAKLKVGPPIVLPS